MHALLQYISLTLRKTFICIWQLETLFLLYKTALTLSSTFHQAHLSRCHVLVRRTMDHYGRSVLWLHLNSSRSRTSVGGWLSAHIYSGLASRRRVEERRWGFGCIIKPVCSDNQLVLTVLTNLYTLYKNCV